VVSIRRYLLLALSATLFIVLVGCSAGSGIKTPNEQSRDSDNALINNDNTAPTDPSQGPALRDYLPDQEMTKVFRGGIKNSGMVHIVDKITDQKIQIKQIDFAAGFVQVLEVTDDSIVRVYGSVTDDLTGDFTLEPNNRNEIILKGPVTVGTTWEAGYSNMTSTITGIDVQLSTPAGEFQAIEITSSDGTYTKISYYGKGIGLLKVADQHYEYILIGVYYNTDDAKNLDNPAEIINKYLSN